MLGNLSSVTQIRGKGVCALQAWSQRFPLPPSLPPPDHFKGVGVEDDNAAGAEASTATPPPVSKASNDNAAARGEGKALDLARVHGQLLKRLA